ncbi:MAG: acyl-ACP--UDP-N-acetylglucosamine O-acyltransferase [Ruegeria sp.]
MSDIHPSAIIEDGAKIGPDCVVGPFCYVGSSVKLGDRVVLKSHVVVTGETSIGDETTIFNFAVIGEIPQDLKFKGENTRLEIGRRNRIREHVTINTGTEGGGGVTRIGDDCLLMAGVHVAHDVQIGNRVIMVNHAGAAGHCIIEDDVLVGGISGLHQFVRIGRGAIIGALTMVANDVIPYGLVQAPRGELDGLNLVGLRRRGVSRADISALRAAFRELSEGDGTFMDRAKRVGEDVDSEYVRQIVDFVTGESDRSFLTPRK